MFNYFNFFFKVTKPPPLMVKDVVEEVFDVMPNPSTICLKTIHTFLTGGEFHIY
jgi:hypothetical protein